MHRDIANLQKLIDSSGWTWAELARRLETTDQRVYNWRKRGLPKDALTKIADLFGVSVDVILTGQVSMRAEHGQGVISHVEEQPGRPNVLSVIRNLEGKVTPRSRATLLRLEKLAIEGKLSDEDWVVLEEIITRFERAHTS